MNTLTFQLFPSDLYARINFLRQNPSKFISYFKFKNQQDCQKTKKRYNLNEEQIKEIIQELENAQKMDCLIKNQTLQKCAEQHAKDIGQNGLNCSINSKRQNLKQRMKSLNIKGRSQEILLFDFSQIKDASMKLLSQKQCRNLIRNRCYKNVGIGINLHSTLNNCISIILTEDQIFNSTEIISIFDRESGDIKLSSYEMQKPTQQDCQCNCILL